MLSTHSAKLENPNLLLLKAASQCVLADVKALINQKADINVQNDKLQSPLILAIQCKKEDKQKERIEVIETLLEAKADPNLGDREGFTPLMALALEESYSMQPLEMLLKAPNIDVNAVSYFCDDEMYGVGNATALHLTTVREQPYMINILRTLLTAKGIDLEIKDQEGVTPLGMCFQVDNEEGVKLLLEAKADLDNTGLPPYERRRNELYQKLKAQQTVKASPLTKVSEIKYNVGLPLVEISLEPPKEIPIESKNNFFTRYDALLIKMQKIKDSLTLPFYGHANYCETTRLKHNEYLSAWLSEGAGRKYAPYIEKINANLIQLLEKNNAKYWYQYGLLNNNLAYFFDMYPEIYQFFSHVLEKNSILEEVHDTFWKGLVLSEEMKKTPASFGVSPDFKKWEQKPEYKSAMTTEKITLRLRSLEDKSQEFVNFVASSDEYDKAITELNMKGKDTQNINTAPVVLTQIKQFIHEMRTKKRSTENPNKEEIDESLKSDIYSMYGIL